MKYLNIKKALAVCQKLKSTRQSHIGKIAVHTETHVIIKGDDAKNFILKREMQIMKVCRMTSSEEYEVISKRERLRKGYISAQKYFEK